jgi:hypothetical protein
MPAYLVPRVPLRSKTQAIVTSFLTYSFLPVGNLWANVAGWQWISVDFPGPRQYPSDQVFYRSLGVRGEAVSKPKIKLITQRSQVQILSPLQRKPLSESLSVLRRKGPDRSWQQFGSTRSARTRALSEVRMQDLDIHSHTPLSRGPDSAVPRS